MDTTTLANDLTQKARKCRDGPSFVANGYRPFLKAIKPLLISRKNFSLLKGRFLISPNRRFLFSSCRLLQELHQR